MTKNGEMPYKGTANNVVMTQVMAGYQHPQPAGCSDEMYQLILACLDMEPLKRPKFAAISGIIAKFKRDSVVSAVSRQAPLDRTLSTPAAILADPQGYAIPSNHACTDPSGDATPPANPYVAPASVAPMTDVCIVPPKPVETAQSEENPYTELISDSGLSPTSNTTAALVRRMSAQKLEGRQATANRQLPRPQMHTSVNETIPGNPYTSDPMTSIV